jgi:hypothetical protein
MGLARPVGERCPAALFLLSSLDPSVNPANSSSSAPRRIVIATRESRLALWQAEHVQSLLRALYPGCEVVLNGMTTRGDQILDRPLSKVGGKGLFVKELEAALLDGSADLAVHSMKDVPMQMEPEFALVAIGPRECRSMRWCRASTPASTTCRPAQWSAPPACAAKPSCMRAIPTSP